MNRWTGTRLVLVASMAALGIAVGGTSASAISLLVKARVPQRSTFDTEMELQGLYDELSEVYGPGLTSDDLHMFNDVVYTPDWIYVDAAGRKLTRAQLDARDAVRPEPDSVIERIGKLYPTADGVTALVTVIVVRDFVDTAGSYGPRGQSHTLSEITPYRDRWERSSDEWKMKSREQAGPKKTVIDKPEWGL